jgi:hypothetical protein
MKPINERRNVQMQSRTRLRSALPFALGVALAFSSAAIAGDLPKEGTYSSTYSGFGTAKSTAVGKDALLVAWDENGLSVGNGLLDYMTWHCWGLYNILGGMAQTTDGYCVATDPKGDQLAATIAGDKYPKDGKSFTNSLTLITGTGKYAGISGKFRAECHHPDFRPAAEGTYLAYCLNQGSYKLP